MISNLVSRFRALSPSSATPQQGQSADRKLGFSSWSSSYWTDQAPITRSDHRPQSPLMGAKVYLRAPRKHDCQQWLETRRKSAHFLKPWEPLWPEDDLTVRGYQRRLRQYRKDMRDGRSLPFFIFDNRTDQLLGGVNVSNIRRGVCQSGSIGYWMGHEFAGKGLMYEAMVLLLPYLFEHNNLHRIEAACLPHNQRSTALLKRLGFQQEGLARQYLRINGQWEDHLLFAILRTDHTGSRVRWPDERI